jgi:hypothetical protein
MFTNIPVRNATGSLIMWLEGFGIVTGSTPRMERSFSKWRGMSWVAKRLSALPEELCPMLRIQRRSEGVTSAGWLFQVPQAAAELLAGGLHGRVHGGASTHESVLQPTLTPLERWVSRLVPHCQIVRQNSSAVKILKSMDRPISDKHLTL